MNFSALQSSILQPLTLQPLTLDQVEASVALDQRCLGGLWTASELSIVGLACLWAILEEAHITLLLVDLPYRGQGFGQMLLYALLRLARQRGLEWATLEVRLSNQTAIALYQKFGFERVGQRRGYYQDNGEDALILWRKGLQRPEFQACLNQWSLEIEQRLAQSGWQIAEFPEYAPLDISSASP